jgi:hypothetical protein
VSEVVLAPLGKLAEALAKFQASVRTIAKDKTARIESAKGKYQYSYADLASVMEAIRAPLSAAGLSVSQPVVFKDGGLWLRTVLIHTSGEFLESFYPLPNNPGSPQAMGSAITYARRYTLSSILGIVTEEDDDARKVKPNVITKQQYDVLVKGAKAAGITTPEEFTKLCANVAPGVNPQRLTVEQYERILSYLNLRGI